MARLEGAWPHDAPVVIRKHQGRDEAVLLGHDPKSLVPERIGVEPTATGILVADRMTAPTSESSQALNDADLPGLYRQAGTEARRWKKLFLWLVSSQLVLLYTGAITGAASRYVAVELTTLLSLLCFLIVAGLRLYQRFSTIGDRWPAARLAAERTKSLAWAYAVGAAPFGLDSKSADEARSQFGEMLRSLFETWPWGGAAPEWADQITSAMQRLRDSPLEDRRASYALRRVEDQAAWYGAKARANANSARRWDLAFAAISVAAITGGVLQIAGVLEFDVLRLAGFAAALIISWTGLNRHRRQAKIYRVTAGELRELESKIPEIEGNIEWNHLVDRVEATIRREEAGWFEARN